MLKQNNGNEFDLMAFPGYREANEKLQAVKSQLSEAEETIRELETNRPETGRARREKEINLVLQGRDPDEIKIESQWREDVEKAKQRANLLRDVIKAREGVLKKEQMEASKKICQPLIPRFESLVKRKAQVWIESGKLTIEEADLLTALKDAGIWYLTYITPMPFLGDLGDPRELGGQSKYAIWLKDAVSRGYITESDIPSEWLKRWKKAPSLY